MNQTKLQGTDELYCFLFTLLCNGNMAESRSSSQFNFKSSDFNFASLKTMICAITITWHEYWGQVQSPAIRVGVNLFTFHLFSQIQLHQLLTKPDSYIKFSAATWLHSINYNFFQWSVHGQRVRVLIHNANSKANSPGQNSKPLALDDNCYYFSTPVTEIKCFVYHPLCSLGNSEISLGVSAVSGFSFLQICICLCQTQSLKVRILVRII